MTKAEELREQEAQKRTAIKAILDKPDTEITDDEIKSVETMKAEVDDLAAKAQKAEELEAFKSANDSELERLNKEPVKTQAHPTKVKDAPAKVEKNWGSGAGLKCFKSDTHANGMSAAEKAGRFGYFIAASLGKSWATKFCKDNGIPLLSGDGLDDGTKAHVETVNTSGGYLVPEEFETTLIDLREQYGVFRRNLRPTPMARDTKTVPKRASGLTAYYVGENASITESTKGWGRVQLIAKKLAVLAKYSSELDEDSIINTGDDLAGEIAYAFANAEDNAGFVGDGTSTYGGITGVRTAIDAVSSNAGIATQLSGNTWAATTLADFNNVKSKLPQYATVRGNCKWFVSSAFWANVMEKLALAAGGVTSLEILSGAPNPRFLGFPVEISQVLPTATAVATIPALLGDLNLACAMGDRRQTTIAFSEHLNFAEDEIAIRGTERFDINCHAPGTSTTAGPVVAYKTGS